MCLLHLYLCHLKVLKNPKNFVLEQDIGFIFLRINGLFGKENLNIKHYKLFEVNTNQLIIPCSFSGWNPSKIPLSTDIIRKCLL